MLLKFTSPSRIEALIEFAISLRGKFFSDKTLLESHKVVQKAETTTQDTQEKKPITNWISSSLSFFTAGLKGPAEESKGTRFVLEEEATSTPADKIEISINILKQENKTQKSENIIKVIKLLEEALHELK